MLPNENLDPYESVDNAIEPVFVKSFFGQVWFDLYFCALIKGTGKIPFDPAMHKPEQKRTSITLTITPLAGSKATFPIERQLIAESREWAGIILPSIKALGLSVRDLNNKYVKVEIVPTGESYVDKKTGDTKAKTTPKFVEVYPDEATCQAASDALFGGHNNTEQPTATSPQNGNAEREVALKFLPALATQAGKDPLKMQELLAGNNLVGKYFTINSPEVIAVLS